MWHGKPTLRLLTVLLPAILFSVVAPAFGQTVSGKLAGAPRWSGEIRLAETVVVPPGVTLKITPGTRIRAERANAVLMINGTLDARGTEKAPIVFSGPAGWEGISFFEAAEGGILEQVRIDHAAVAVSSIAAKFVLRGCRFTGNGTAVKLLRESYPLIEDCRFADNDIAIDNEMKSVATVRGSHFSGHKKSAIVASHGSRGAITGNRFEKNRQAVALVQKYPDPVENNDFIDNGVGIFCNQTQNTPAIRHNRFEKNETALINFSFAYPAVEHNFFTDNGTAVRNDQFASPKIFRNLFRGNGTALFNDRKSDPEVTRNQFEKNDLVLFCDHSSYPLFRENNLLGNPQAVRLGIFQSADWEARSGSKKIVQEKARQLNSRNPLIERIPSDFRDRVEVAGNWWGEDMPRLRQAREETNLDLFHDRLDQPTVTYEGYGDEAYRLDRVVFQPVLDQAVADTLPEAQP
jgi:nitrous oxidase accessory protein NosD